MMRSVTRIFLLLVAASILGATTSSAKSPLTPIQQMFLLKKMKPDVEKVGIIWAKDAPGHDELMPQIKRAATSSGVKLFVSYVTSMKDVANHFRQLEREHGINALWIVDDSGVLSNDVARSFLIKNTTKSGIPMLAPSQDWVTAGASVSLQKTDGEIQIVLNKAAAAATALAVPADYENQTQYL